MNRNLIKSFFLAALLLPSLSAVADDCPSDIRAVTTIYRIDPGCAYGVFSVGDNQRVFFSNGNLQFNSPLPSLSTDTLWRFSPAQAATVSEENLYQGRLYDIWYDLFPASRHSWGDTQAVMNGGNQPDRWRTLSESEWSYLLARTDTFNLPLYAFGQLDVRMANRYGVYQHFLVNGLLLLPDFYATDSVSLNRTSHRYADNFIEEAEWLQMEKNGVVFLPCAGYMQNVNSQLSFLCPADGAYWIGDNRCLVINQTDGIRILTLDPADSPFVSIRPVRDLPDAL